MVNDIIGKRKIRFKSLDSTNDYCKNLLARQEVPEGTVIWTPNQLMGRGQETNLWESGKGENLTFSIILHPHFLQVSEQFNLSMIIALGVMEFLDEYIESVTVKWPNDIYAGTKKIAGVLIENYIIDNTVTDSILGVGININQSRFGDHIPDAISLRNLTSGIYDLEICLDKVCRRIDRWYLLLKQGERAIILNNYTSRLFRLNEKHGYESSDGIFRGYIRGIDDFGQLKIEDEKGHVRHFGLKQVKFLI
jgi:BirA family transcriptional regulator, biotin operon repressor / biotin---[acetyl-CoA-carboxylase] ligase